MMQLVGPLTASVPTHWALVPTAEQRIRTFITRFHSDQDPDDLVRTFRAHFAADSGLAPCWLWLDEDAIVGHLLAWLDASPRRRSLFVGQVWSDQAVPEALRTQLVEQLEAHARALQCTSLEGWVENPAILRLYRRLGMATPVMTAVRRVLDAPKEPELHVIR